MTRQILGHYSVFVVHKVLKVDFVPIRFVANNLLEYFLYIHWNINKLCNWESVSYNSTHHQICYLCGDQLFENRYVPVQIIAKS